MNDNNDIYKKYYKINKDLNEEIQKLKENMSKNKEYFDYYEKKIELNCKKKSMK